MLLFYGFPSAVHKVHFVDMLVNMKMPAEPRFVRVGCLDFAEPLLGAFINLGLVDTGEENFDRLILERASVGYDDINLVFGELFFHKGLYFLCGLFALPPTYTARDAVELINAVCSSNWHNSESVNGVYLSVFCEE